MRAVARPAAGHRDVPERRDPRMRYTPSYSQLAVSRMLDTTRILRWLWLGRATLGFAILVAAVFVWERARPEDTLVATLGFAGALLASVASAMWVEIYRRPAGRGFLLAQCGIDLLLVTAVVHVTGGWSSQFAALYILVIAIAALLLPFREGILVAVAACALYAVDVLVFRHTSPQLTVWVQLGVFVVVSIGSGVIAARLREAGAGRDALAAQLVKVQLEAADILRSIQSGIVTVDDAGRLLYANPAAAGLLGLPLRDLVGRPLLGTLVAVAPELADVLGDTVREGLPRRRAEGVIHRDGRTVLVGLTTTCAEREGGGRTATAIFQDISDTKRLQALHVRTERLQAVAELSASLAHEIRNPLASIRSATEQLARRHARRGDGDEDERALFALTVREADRLSRLLAEFLDFARTRATQLAPVDVAAVARAAVALVGQHPERGPDVAVTCDAPTTDGACIIAGDDDLLHRAVFNLVLNAVQAVGPTGRVHVVVRPATDAALAGDGIAVVVEDDGPGIAPEVRDRLFEPFVTSKPGGSGLGLAIVHRAAEAHRGAVLVDALPHRTRFTLLVPRAQPVDARPAVERPTPVSVSAIAA
jgi:two-component system sensor histidine kinase PilS (NtrC family)